VYGLVYRFGLACVPNVLLSIVGIKMSNILGTPVFIIFIAQYIFHSSIR
jgi:hypothetical protein